VPERKIARTEAKTPENAACDVLFRADVAFSYSKSTQGGKVSLSRYIRVDITMSRGYSARRERVAEALRKPKWANRLCAAEEVRNAKNVRAADDDSPRRIRAAT
jgi:hypothetical protein